MDTIISLRAVDKQGSLLVGACGGSRQRKDEES
jgi:hypothetical protein